MKIFFKAQFSAFVGGLVDYGFMLLFTEVFSFFYPVSIVLSGFIGAVVNFTINRYWAFNAQEEQTQKQLQRFVFIVIGSVLLKSGGTYLLTQVSGLDYKWNRIIVDIIVSFGFNYTLQKYWVFKPVKR